MSQRGDPELEKRLEQARELGRQYAEIAAPIDDPLINRIILRMRNEWAIVATTNETDRRVFDNQVFMEGCPPVADASNCAMMAAQYLVDREAVMLNLFSTAKGRILVKEEEQEASRMFIVRDLHFDGDTSVEVAELSCLACGRCLQIVDQYGDVSVRSSK